MTVSVTESKIMKQLIKIIAVLLCITLLVACGGKAGNSSQSGSSESSKQGSESLSGDNSLPQQDASQLDLAKQNNADTVAWLRIPGTDIDNPVMQTANNEDYLRRDENGKNDVWGCYFADYYSSLSARETLGQNTVIYGHSESTENPDGKRFTQLFHYLDLDFLKENPYIYLSITDEELVFEVFAVFFTDTDFYYIDPQPSDQGFESFAKTIASKNEYIFEGNGMTDKDKLLTLSTCAYRYDTKKTGNQRLVVMAKLVDTTNSSEPSKITKNPTPARPK